MKTLLVAEHGNKTGYPFNSLFGNIECLVEGEIYNATRCLKDAGALLLFGGTDISPSLYKEKPNFANEASGFPSRRDLFEWTLIKEAVATGVPIIGICRGAQLLCAFDGGTLAQDISGHSAGHDIITKDGEVMWAAANHHQMMLPLPHNMVLATTIKPLHEGFYLGENDSINPIHETFLEPEAVYFPHLKAVGFQPHPEWMGNETDFVAWCRTTVKEFLL